jgi:hypothetical protein
MERHILDYLKEKYLEGLREQAKGGDTDATCTLSLDLGVIDKFVAFAKKSLNEDPPISVGYGEGGIGLHMQSGELLLFADMPTTDDISRSLPITMPPRGHQMGMPPDESVPFTSNKK